MSNFARKFTTKMNKTAQHIIDIKNVSKRFGEKTALNNINLYVRKGEFMTILGPSGCGKTTLLRLLAVSYSVVSPIYFAMSIFT